MIPFLLAILIGYLVYRFFNSKQAEPPKEKKIDLAYERLMPIERRPKKRYPITLTTNFVETVRNVKREYIIDDEDIKDLEDGESLYMYLYEHMKVRLEKDGEIYDVLVCAKGLDVWEDIGYIIRSEELEKDLEESFDKYVEIEGGKTLVKHGRRRDTDFEPFSYNLVLLRLKRDSV